MKHTTAITGLLVTLFVASQLVGLGLLSASLETTTDEAGNVRIDYSETAIGPRPETTGAQSFIYLAIGILVGTTALFILAKLKQALVWKIWFFIAVWLTITVAIGVLTSAWIAALIALLLAAWKIFKPDIFIHNITEVLVYTGIAVLLVPIFDLLWASLVLLAIAGYDAIAVWKSKHMVTLAKFQTDNQLFAGLFLPYDSKTGRPVAAKPAKTPEKTTKKTSEGNGKTAILGGGDIAFPLLFNGAVMQWLITQGYDKASAFSLSLTVIATGAIALLGLFVAAEKDKFYPAMPFLAAGCFVGLGLVWLII